MMRITLESAEINFLQPERRDLFIKIILADVKKKEKRKKNGALQESPILKHLKTMLLKLHLQDILKRMFRSLRIHLRQSGGVRQLLKLLLPGSLVHMFHSLRMCLDRFSLP